MLCAITLSIMAFVITTSSIMAFVITTFSIIMKNEELN